MKMLVKIGPQAPLQPKSFKEIFQASLSQHVNQKKTDNKAQCIHISEHEFDYCGILTKGYDKRDLDRFRRTTKSILTKTNIATNIEYAIHKTSKEITCRSL